MHGLCNLACDHCYVYELADQTWRDKPAFMAPGTVRHAAARIAEHAAEHSLGAVGIVLHGGEPLLMGAPRLRETLTVLDAAIAPVAWIDWRMQTNGILLTDEIGELLLEFGVKVGVSLDGDREANDRHRRYRHGGGSHPETLRGLALLRKPRFRELYAGLLCTIDVRNDPIAVYEALLAQEPPHVDLLLPHATWDEPPPYAQPGTTPYADWLLRVHDRWLADGRPVPIRSFDALHTIARGGRSETEAVGVDRGIVAVIETDGTWEQPDSMKVAFHGAAGTGRDVVTTSADELLDLPAMRHRQSGLAGLSATCRACPVVARCGGGLYAHRYRTGSGFDNPSVYCADLKGLITSMDSAPQPVGNGLPVLPDWVFDELASGGGGPLAIAYLTAAQESITRALLVAVAGHADETAARAWPLLADLDKQSPAAVRAVVTHPFVRTWAVQCLRDGHDTARLADVVAAVVIAAGTDAQVEVTPRNGQIHLPSIGTLTAPTPANVMITSRALTATGPLAAGTPAETLAGTSAQTPPGVAGVGGVVVGSGFAPVRTVEVDGRVLRLEDADPYRDCHEWPATGPLTDGDAEAWATSLTAAWRELSLDAPEQLAGLGELVTVVTPLVAAADGTLRSATSQQAFGALGIAATDDPAALAVMLVHEFQHAKLGAVLDLYDLVDPDSADPVTVGWRPDARPAELALQGTYAHLAVADIWRRRALRSAPGAAGYYTMYRDWTLHAADALRNGTALTERGRRFVDGIAATIARWPK
ncbi:hypothetical protein GCM10010435_90700 [Winogradskya consettensis]|uniref:Radical SAM core domain-containing protein n=1 Tax=Winogradskya consettensis TaxID=113560 RepID=A0A919SWW5_9ACTN|nr:hypothetical protein Aco04nite_68330 [Actinoplanes consettensis]